MRVLDNDCSNSYREHSRQCDQNGLDMNEDNAQYTRGLVLSDQYQQSQHNMRDCPSCGCAKPGASSDLASIQAPWKHGGTKKSKKKHHGKNKKHNKHNKKHNPIKGKFPPSKSPKKNYNPYTDPQNIYFMWDCRVHHALNSKYLPKHCKGGISAAIPAPVGGFDGDLAYIAPTPVGGF